MTMRHHICPFAQCEMSLCVTNGLVTKFDSRKLVLLMDESIMCTLCVCDRSFIGQLHLTETVAKFFICKMHYHLFNTRHHTSEIYPFTRETTVRIYASKSTKPVPAVPIRLLLRLQLPLPSSMHIEHFADHSSAPLPMSRPPMQAIHNQLVKPSPTNRELVRPLQNETNRPFRKSVFLSLFLQMRISLSNPFPFLSHSRYVLESLRTVNCRQTRIDELPCAMADFNFHMQKELTNSRQ